MDRYRVVVLRGGPSEEYDVSLKTGKSVLKALTELGYTPIDVVISQNGEWIMQGVVCDPGRILKSIDMAFLALHGAYGEDGTVQRLLDSFAIPYSGSGAFASSLAMHKERTKEHLKDLSVNFAPHRTIRKESGPDYARIAYAISNSFGPEYVVKPVTGGSSVGTMMVKGEAELQNALKDALSVYDSVMVEKRIRGREATCGVIERFRDQSLYTLPCIEIKPPQSADFFDKTVKYDGSTEELCPSTFSEGIKKALEEYAASVHRALNLSQYSRSDFIVDESGVEPAIYFLEVNTLPGLTEQSLFPKALNAVGCSYQQFIDHLVNDSLKRHNIL